MTHRRTNQMEILMSEPTDFFIIGCDSSEEDTYPYGHAKAIKKVFGDLIEDIEVGDDGDGDWDDRDSYRAPNHGQYTQTYEITLSRPMTVEEFDALMETVEGSFGFDNGWDFK